MTPVQRAAWLIQARDLDRLRVILSTQRTINTNRVLRELCYIERRLKDHGRAVRQMYNESKS